MDEDGQAHQPAQAEHRHRHGSRAGGGAQAGSVSSVFLTDLFKPLVELGEEIAGKRYGEDRQVDVALRVLADHSRAMSFLVADGVLPSNEGRGYVLRRVIRRAARFSRSVGHGAAVPRSVSRQRTIELMGGAYPELVERRETILRTVGLRGGALQSHSRSGPGAGGGGDRQGPGRGQQRSSPARWPSSCTTPTASRWRSPGRSSRSAALLSTWTSSSPPWRTSASVAASAQKGGDALQDAIVRFARRDRPCHRVQGLRA